jgi:hypothetical protein
MMNMFTLNSINGNYFTGQPSLLWKFLFE